jgi:aminodeoxyfutalosine deaminase
MSQVHRGLWVLPMDAPPIRDGWVEVEAGRVVAIGGPEAHPRGDRLANSRRDVAILPGLVNAHTHLELSWMAGLVPPSESMGQWIRALMALRRNAPPAEDLQRQAAVAAVARARACGTSAFGDIGNTLMAASVLADAGIPAVLFHELIGFGPGDAQARASEAATRVMQAVTPPVTAGLAPHAPYSVSPDLFRAVADEAALHRLPSSVHLAESREEVDFLLTGSGDIADTLKHLGAWNDAWSPPKVDPAEYLDRLGVLRSGLLAVHATQLTAAALGRLADRGCVIVSCPRSNRWVGAGAPPLDAFYASGARVAFGTDSLASVEDLNLFSELAAARRLAPAVSARRLLASATIDGAAALGLARELGTISPGKRADLLAIRVPPRVQDVEEYLVGGIEPSAIEWVGQGS